MPQMSPMYWMLILVVSFFSLLMLIFYLNCFMKDYYLDMIMCEFKSLKWNWNW